MELEAVTSSYRRWAPVYDETFGAFTAPGRRRAIRRINRRGGASVLEVGVGTGLSLRHYGPKVEVTGIDFSADMLARAKARVKAKKLKHVVALERMDARSLAFPDNRFDSVVAMHLISVVPEPERVVSEMARVCRPGGEVLLLNHFLHEKGALAYLGRRLGPLANQLGLALGFHDGAGADLPGARTRRAAVEPAVRDVHAAAAAQARRRRKRAGRGRRRRPRRAPPPGSTATATCRSAGGRLPLSHPASHISIVPTDGGGVKWLKSRRSTAWPAPPSRRAIRPAAAASPAWKKRALACETANGTVRNSMRSKPAPRSAATTGARWGFVSLLECTTMRTGDDPSATGCARTGGAR